MRMAQQLLLRSLTLFLRLEEVFIKGLEGKDCRSFHAGLHRHLLELDGLMLPFQAIILAYRVIQNLGGIWRAALRK